MTEQTLYHVETATGDLTTTDYEQARTINRANPGSSMWKEILATAATVLVTFGAIIAATPAPAANADPTLQEDDPGWSCIDSASRVCGPLSDDWGHTPGCYDDTRTLVASWPCSVVVNPDGSSDIYTPDAR